MNLIISRNPVFVNTHNIGNRRRKRKENLSKQRTVCGDRAYLNRDRYTNSTIGKACLQHYVSEEYF
jgi:hypothetical protein